MKTGSRFECVQAIKASPAHVFSYLVEPKHLTRWFCDRAEIKAHKAGSLKVWWDLEGGESYGGAAMLSMFEQDSELELIWEQEFEGSTASDVSGEHSLHFLLEQIAEGTLVALTVFDNPELSKQELEETRADWQDQLSVLKSVCERGKSAG